MDDVEFTAFGFGHVGGSLQDVGVKPVALYWDESARGRTSATH